jgi:hypothetical protein
MFKMTNELWRVKEQKKTSISGLATAVANFLFTPASSDILKETIVLP